MNASPAVREQLHQTALRAPSSSGVYLWRNEQDAVIYVGKAKNLKNRLSSYFSGTKDVKTRLLVSRAHTIEYITTANEYEAFLLENTLIKKYSPRYNINLKDGKSYPVLRITNEPFPRLFKTRHMLNDGSTYFGPFPDVGALDTFIDALYRLYPLRHCRTLKKRDTPSMYYHMGWCGAPCCGKISRDVYNQYIGEIKRLLEGKGEETMAKLTAEMQAAAADLNFEKAARLRDGIAALRVMQNQNAVVGFDSEDRDYIAHWREGELVSVTVLKVRDGKLTVRDNFRLISLNEDAELLDEFLTAYYTEAADVPPCIYVPDAAVGGSLPPAPAAPARLPLPPQRGTPPQRPRSAAPKDDGRAFLPPHELERWFREALGADTRVTPVTGSIENARRHIASINMALHNAHEDIIRRLRERGDLPALEELKTLLKLPHLPVRIEGFDIAHIGGKFPVASLISFYNGNPDRKNYRYFRLKTTDGIIDDFASLREAVSRRYTRLLNEQSDLPDLLLIDGGIGQVNAVAGVLSALHLDIPIAGLAKRDEEIYRPGDSTPVRLPRRSDALRLLQRVRDETHRFATSRNQALRTKENTVSIFRDLPGVGEARARTLIKRFSTLENLTAASAETLAAVLRVDLVAADQLLSAARALCVQQEQAQAAARHELGTVSTTKQKAAERQYVADLAERALAVADNPPDYTAAPEH
ncbi:MAG: excinuclease ABC subunit C [Treponema sp.]|nr:excinuclease ABC subunit C [Treponema sp.]